MIVEAHKEEYFFLIELNGRHRIKEPNQEKMSAERMRLIGQQ